MNWIRCIKSPIILAINKLRWLYWCSLVLIRLKGVKNILQDSNFGNIKLYKIKNWHHGFGYITATRNRENYFIKIDTVFKCTLNELTIHHILNKIAPQYLTEVKFFYESSQYQIIGFEYIEDVLFCRQPEPKHMLQLFDLLKVMDSMDIYHRDLRPENIIIRSGELKVIDWTFAAIRFSAESRLPFAFNDKRSYGSVQKALCQDAKPSTYTWNDAYSVLYYYRDYLEKLDNGILEELEVMATSNNYSEEPYD